MNPEEARLILPCHRSQHATPRQLPWLENPDLESRRESNVPHRADVPRHPAETSLVRLRCARFPAWPSTQPPLAQERLAGG